MTTSPPDKPRKDTRLPSLFALETQLFGWQGLTATLPADWNLARYDMVKGELRIADEEMPRLELRWEIPKTAVDLEKSVEKFLDTVGRQARKKKEKFEIEDGAKIVAKTRKRKAQLVNFAWTGERANLIGQGCGVAWQCGECGRIVVAHIMGRGTENRESLQKLAGEILTTLECHGSGGWQTWSVFGLRVEVPEEFQLSHSKLMAGRLELVWKRPKKPGALNFAARDETLSLARISLADVLLQNETLSQWTGRTLWRADKQWFFMDFEETKIGEHDAVRSEGLLRDVRLRLRSAVADWVRRRRSPRAELQVWHSLADNKIYALTSDLLPANAHVATEVLDSLEGNA